MTGGEMGEELPGRRVLINPKEMKPNPAIPVEVWDKLLSLPSQTLPKKQARPVKRLTALAHELAADGLLANAGKIAHAEMHKVLDGAQVRYAEEIKVAREAVLTVEGKTVKADIETKAMTFDDFIEAADYAVIEDAYKRAARVVTPDLSKTYSEHLANQSPDNEDPDDALIESPIPPDDLDQITAPTTKDEQVPGEWILLQRLFGLRRQRREPAPHVGHTGSQPDTRVRGYRDHVERPRISRANASGS
ncbi:hypothetical protein MACH17_39790 [Phaeobacter inhibens]|nr:hypothetical protein MACH17_39790 [Phaeobacter inhibens]